MSAQLQQVYDALKRCREDGEAWVTWGNERLRITPVPDDTSFSFYGGHLCIVKSRMQGGIAVAMVTDKDGLRIDEERPPLGRYRSHRGQYREVLAIIREWHPRDPSKPSLLQGYITLASPEHPFRSPSMGG